MPKSYIKDEIPFILLSALRPLARRRFTCAHEIGHHVFGHGTSFDELVDGSKEKKFDPKEFLVNTFAGFLLMPIIAVRKAFASRGWNLASATPVQLFTVACSFGVGYTTLINHIAYGLESLDKTKSKSLVKTKLRTIRQEVLGYPSDDQLIIADLHWSLPTIDAEVGNLILLPQEAKVIQSTISIEADIPSGRLFRANKPGSVQVSCPDAGWALPVRVSRQAYVGLNRHRYIEEVDSEQ